jgi:hypothetical protein
MEHLAPYLSGVLTVLGVIAIIYTITSCLKIKGLIGDIIVLRLELDDTNQELSDIRDVLDNKINIKVDRLGSSVFEQQEQMLDSISALELKLEQCTKLPRPKKKK